jgi:hypothetical protein
MKWSEEHRRSSFACRFRSPRHLFSCDVTQFVLWVLTRGCAQGRGNLCIPRLRGGKKMRKKRYKSYKVPGGAGE